MIQGLRARGFNTLKSATPIVPIVAGNDDQACSMAKLSQDRGVYVLPVLTPAVPLGSSRLRVTITSSHTQKVMTRAMDVFEQVGRKLGALT